MKSNGNEYVPHWLSISTDTLYSIHTICNGMANSNIITSHTVFIQSTRLEKSIGFLYVSNATINQANDTLTSLKFNLQQYCFIGRFSFCFISSISTVAFFL